MGSVTIRLSIFVHQFFLDDSSNPVTETKDLILHGLLTLLQSAPLLDASLPMRLNSRNLQPTMAVHMPP